MSIVIPVHNGRELLGRLLESIDRQTAKPLEVIVVDNGSSDGAPEDAKAAGAHVITMGGNAGFAAAVNRGIGEARGEAIALVNSDVTLEDAWLESLWKGMERHGADFATGTILQAGADGVLDGAYDLICRGGCSWRAGAGKSPSALGNAPLPIRFCSATAALYRAELLRDIGGFEEAFESYLEDVDFGLKCAVRGKTGIYLPEAVCRHVGSATFGRWNPRVVRLIARNQVFLLSRHYPSRLIGRWWWQILTAQILWGGLALRHGCGMAWMRGKAEGIRGFDRMRKSGSSVEAVVVASEREIYSLQSSNGFDSYWRWYFRLAGVAG